MAVNLSNVKEGDIFKTKSGEYMGYLLSDSPIFGKYQHKLYNLKNKTQSLWYNNDGVCGDESKRDQFNLVEKIEQISEEEKQLIEEAKNNQTQSESVSSLEGANSISDDLEISSGWESVLKVFGWITLVGCIVAFFILLGDYQLDNFAWIPLVYGIIQIAPIMVFANISVSLKEGNALKRKIFNEIKNANKSEEK